MAKDLAMKIESILLFPIKSMRGINLDKATVTKHGFPYDRTFVVLKPVKDKETGDNKYEHMSVANYNMMVRFFPSIKFAEDGDETGGVMTITFHPLNGGETNSIDVPLVPDTSNLEQVDVLMHLSPAKAYKMDDKINAWLSSCFGYECILAYISDNLREVRMSSDSYKTPTNSQPNSWLSSISSIASKASELVIGSAPQEVSGIRFSDVAPYLFVSSKSMDDINPRCQADGQNFDITKFRPNVIVSGAQQAWEEDYWGELTIGEKTKIELEHNCARCRSINIDYETGDQGSGEAGKMLKKLSADRRVDKGAKWSPVFGRYGFLHPDSEGNEIRVGEEVKVSRLNKERTAFDWQGLSTLKGGGRD